jgi:hypothetical protein
LSSTRWQKTRLCRLIFAPSTTHFPSVRAGLAFSGEVDPPSGLIFAPLATHLPSPSEKSIHLWRKVEPVVLSAVVGIAMQAGPNALAKKNPKAFEGKPSQRDVPTIS